MWDRAPPCEMTSNVDAVGTRRMRPRSHRGDPRVRGWQGAALAFGRARVQRSRSWAPPRSRASRLSTMTDSLISSAYSQALEVIASVEPRIAEATRQELADQRGSL